MIDIAIRFGIQCDWNFGLGRPAEFEMYYIRNPTKNMPDIPSERVSDYFSFRDIFGALA